MKKLAIVIVIGFFLVVGTFGTSFAACWYGTPMDVIQVNVSDGGVVEAKCMVEGTPRNFRTDIANPPVSANAILAVLLTAAASDKQVTVQMEGNFLVGARIFN